MSRKLDHSKLKRQRAAQERGSGVDPDSTLGRWIEKRRRDELTKLRKRLKRRSRKNPSRPGTPAVGTSDTRAQETGASTGRAPTREARSEQPDGAERIARAL